jgi:glycerol kinase
LLTTVAYRFNDEPARYALEGSVAVTGALVQWLRDNLKIIGSSKEIEAMALGVPDNGGVYFVPAFAGLFAPRWRPDARGTIVGLTGHSDRGHIARAALEAAAYQTREVLDAMSAEGNVALKSLKIDGGLSANDLLMQFQADMLNIPVVRSHVLETTALGAAYAAGLAVGVWKNTNELASHWQAGKTWTPQMKDAERSRLYDRWLKAVDRSLCWEESNSR